MCGRIGATAPIQKKGRASFPAVCPAEEGGVSYKEVGSGRCSNRASCSPSRTVTGVLTCWFLRPPALTCTVLSVLEWAGY